LQQRHLCKDRFATRSSIVAVAMNGLRRNDDEGRTNAGIKKSKKAKVKSKKKNSDRAFYFLISIPNA
jgi:hypothetical protein